jgi:Domain of unknown function (DUF4383)
MTSLGARGAAEPTTTPERALEAERPLAPVQWAAIIGSLVVLMWSVPGLIVNPDFHTGDAATSKLVLGVDMNGWHAVSGFLVAIPGFFAALRRSWSAAFTLAAAASLIATGIWALLDSQVAAGLFYFPNNGGDALLHFATSAIFLAGAAHYFLTRP